MYVLLPEYLRDMAYKNSYISDIQNYFLFLVDRGIMLSPKDYDLIMKWKRRGVPKEIVYRGINKAIENLRKKRSSISFLRGLDECAPFIEGEIRNHRSSMENESVIESTRGDIIKRVAERLAAIITNENMESIRRHYIEIRKRVLDLTNSNEDVFKAIEKIEEESYEDFFQTLSPEEKKRIGQMAEGMIDKERGHLMTDKARRESVLSFRNEILRRDYKLIRIFS